MASTGRGIWAIDIGNNSLKALHLRTGGAKLEVVGFDHIEHGKILSGASGISDKEKSELIAASLHRFVEQNQVGNDEVMISVAGQMSFARFIKLPPVEPKKIPQMVQFEAGQQIPFDINEVEWDYQVMAKPDSPDVEVGIFAIKNEIISGVLEYFARENLKVVGVQMAPMALYNFANYERGEGPDDKSAIIVLDMGAENTDLVISTRTNVWQRSIPLGGNAFTRAVAEAFKLDFEKAERLKRTAPMSKYARQIFQSMKPVFSDLAAEIQRSLGFYSTSNREVKFQKVIALGGGMKMQGLTKFLQQTIQLTIVRPDSFDQLELGKEVSAAKFHENVADFGTVYGLAVQGLGKAKIESNLLPRKIARTMAWGRKSSYFTAAAGILLVISLMAMGRAMVDRSNYVSKQSIRDETSSILSMAQDAKSKLDQENQKVTTYDSSIEKQLGIFKYRDIVAKLYTLIIKCMPNSQNTAAQKTLYAAFDNGDSEAVKTMPRAMRKQLFVTRASIRYAENISGEGFGETATTTAQSAYSGGGMGGGMGGMGMPGMGMPGMGMPGMGMPGMGGPGMGGGGGYSQAPAAASGPSEPGFVVVIEGYSPYKNVNELLDPPGVANAKERWGVVTRLLNLNTIEPNCAFKLFNKAKPQDFKLEFGEVDLGKPMPVGIGIEQDRTIGQGNKQVKQKVLVDPMTREVINKVAKVNDAGVEIRDKFGRAIYETNDNWFRISAKFAWDKEGKGVAQNQGGQQ